METIGNGDQRLERQAFALVELILIDIRIDDLPDHVFNFLIRG